MTDLRKAAEMALAKLDHLWEIAVDERMNTDVLPEIQALRQALAQPEQEPVAWVYNGILHEFDPSEFATSEVKPLYTAPQKREWVGLTDAERFYCNEFPMADCCSDSIIRAEELLKEKNT